MLAIVIAGVGGGSSLFGTVALLVLVAVLVALTVMLAAGGPGAGRLDGVGDDHVTIDHPELLRTPVILPRAAVRTVLVDVSDSPPTGAAAGGPPELAARFPLVEAGGDPAWLHPGARSALPMLGWQRAVPDGAVVLRGPLALGTAPRRLLAFFEGNEELRALSTCGGFFLQLADPPGAATALAAEQLDPPLTLAEAERLDDLAEDRRLGRRREPRQD